MSLSSTRRSGAAPSCAAFSGAPEAASELRAQMARYVAAVQAAQPGEPVRAAFVTARGELREL